MMPVSVSPPPVLILGAGINGCCVAREIVLNGVPVVIVDRHDIATGATAKSSRLIHGGVRYLEYGDFGLVRESLAERARLLRLAPQFVRPLRLHIPVRRRTGGLLQSALRFLRFDRLAAGRWLAKRLPISERGLWTIRIGLWLYDLIARDSTLPRHSVARIGNDTAPRVDAEKYRWLCAYSDAQILYPERFVIALLEDARREAARAGVDFRVFTYCQTELDGPTTRVHPIDDPDQVSLELLPATIVNATGAWGDLTLGELCIPSPQLFGGTKGSHIITRQPALVAALGGDAIYAEAADGRLVFLLPFGESVLIGTTDEPITESPDEAVATPQDVDYLVGMVNEVFSDVRLTVADVDAHYCGVRPLPNVNAARAGAIPRGHWIETSTAGPVPVDTLIGGKLTTCRAFGELAADRILRRLRVKRTAGTQTRAVPGSDEYPAGPEVLAERIGAIADATGFSADQVSAVWDLVGTDTRDILSAARGGDRADLPGTSIPLAFVDWSIAHEWVRHVEDLIERRLMLAWEPGLCCETLKSLAGRLQRACCIRAQQIDTEIANAAARLERFYGRRVS
jgi:glycerol-3-phosphate dehydrogenase